MPLSIFVLHAADIIIITSSYVLARDDRRATADAREKGNDGRRDST